MNATLTRRIIGLLTACSFVMFAGCSTLESVSGTAPEDNTILLRALNPEQPATLLPGDRLEVKIGYERITTNETVIFVRPYANGQQAADYEGHPPVTCTGARGSVTGWLSFPSNAVIDEIRVTMLDNTERVVLKSERYPVEYHWAD